MDIFALRKNVFNDLTDRACVKGLVPDSARVWGNTAYFFSNGQD